MNKINYKQKGIFDTFEIIDSKDLIIFRPRRKIQLLTTFLFSLLYFIFAIFNYETEKFHDISFIDLGFVLLPYSPDLFINKFLLTTFATTIVLLFIFLIFETLIINLNKRIYTHKKLYFIKEKGHISKIKAISVNNLTTSTGQGAKSTSAWHINFLISGKNKNYNIGNFSKKEDAIKLAKKISERLNINLIN